MPGNALLPQQCGTARPLRGQGDGNGTAIRFAGNPLDKTAVLQLGQHLADRAGLDPQQLRQRTLGNWPGRAQGNQNPLWLPFPS